MFTWPWKRKERPREPYTADELKDMVRGQAFADLLPICPSVPEVCMIHKAACLQLVPRAGQMRQPMDKGVAIGRAKTAPAHRIKREFELLDRQWADLPKDTVVSKALAIGYYHLKFEGIHPFSDGNGRVGRMIMTRQARELLGVLGHDLSERLVGTEKARRAYYAAFEASYPKGIGKGSLDLAPMANLILVASGLTPTVGRTRVPFRIPPSLPTDPYESEAILPPFALEFAASKLGPDDRNPFAPQPTLATLSYDR